MYPHTTYDKENGLAYITFSSNKIEKSIESDDELLIFDVDKNGGIVGIEILSIQRLQKNFEEYSSSKADKFSPEIIPAYLIPFVVSSNTIKSVSNISTLNS